MVSLPTPTLNNQKPYTHVTVFQTPFTKPDNHLPLLDHGTHLVTGQVHAVEVGEAVLALNILGDELELTEGHLIVLQVSKAHLEHTSLKTIRGDFWFDENNNVY